MSNNIISYYGAGLSTFVFFWKLFDEWKTRKGNIKIEINFTTQFIIIGNGPSSDSERMLTIKITNFGRSNRHIQKPSFITNCNEINLKYFEIIDLESKQEYPKEIKPGEIHIVRYPLKSFNIKEKKITKIRINLNDTLKKSYKSKWIDIKDFKL